MAKVIYPAFNMVDGSFHVLWKGNVGTIWREDLKVVDPTWKDGVSGIPGAIIIRGFERTNEFHLYIRSLEYDTYRLICYPDLHGNVVWSRDLKFLAYWVHGQKDLKPYNMMDVDVMIRVTK